MATIVQNYGPIYGEVVNGTVQGRPNGSVYVPISNTIAVSILDARKYIKNSSGTQLRICNSSGNATSDGLRYSAIAQDLSSYVVSYVYSDAELTTQIGYKIANAGNFNSYFRDYITTDAVIEAGATYYLVAQLCNNSVPIATSDVIPVVGVV